MTGNNEIKALLEMLHRNLAYANEVLRSDTTAAETEKYLAVKKHCLSRIGEIEHAAAVADE